MEVPIKVAMKSLVSKVMSLIKRAASFTATLIILAAAAVAVLYVAKIKPYVVTTGSMEPAIPVRSVCFVNENVPIEQVKVGEVIAFRLGENTLVTHRLVRTDGDEYITKGDANNKEDAPITKKNYIGKNVLVIPKIGVLLIFLHSTRGKIVAAAAVLLLLIISFFPKKDGGKVSEAKTDDQNENSKESEAEENEQN